MKPLGARVIIRPDAAEETTASGIVIPATAKETPQTGVVVEAGSECRDVAAGDKVLYSKYGGQQVRVGEDDLVVLREADIYAVLP